MPNDESTTQTCVKIPMAKVPMLLGRGFGEFHVVHRSCVQNVGRGQPTSARDIDTVPKESQLLG